MLPRSSPWRAKDTLLSQPYLNGWYVKTGSQGADRNQLPRCPALLCSRNLMFGTTPPCGAATTWPESFSTNIRLRTPCTLKSEYSCHRNHLWGTQRHTVRSYFGVQQYTLLVFALAFRGYEFFASPHNPESTGNNDTVRDYTRAEPTKRLICRGNASSKVVSRLRGEGQLL